MLAALKRMALFILLFALLLAFQTGASMLGGRAANALGLRANDPAMPYQWLSVHHIVQMALALLLIGIISLARKTDFCLRPRVSRRGNWYLLIFCAAVAIAALVGYRLMYPSNKDIFFNYPLSAGNMAGMLGFQALLSGPSEEIIFRALPITLFLAALRGGRERASQWLATLAAAALFSLGHVSWYTDPFRLSFSWFQLAYCFLYGVAYGVAYLQTRSVLCPMLMHSASNILMVGLGYVCKLLLPWG